MKPEYAMAQQLRQTADLLLHEVSSDIDDALYKKGEDLVKHDIAEWLYQAARVLCGQCDGYGYVSDRGGNLTLPCRNCNPPQDDSLQQNSRLAGVIGRFIIDNPNAVLIIDADMPDNTRFARKEDL